MALLDQGEERAGEMAVAPTPTIGGTCYVSGGTRMEEPAPNRLGRSLV